MSLRPLKVAVVGHTNTGKTSLLRTLTRDVTFGEVSNRPATTQHVAATSLTVDGQPLIELYDTPGLEDSINLLDYLDTLRGTRRADGIEVIEEFLKSDAAADRFSQEAKAVRQLLASDAAIYVIDSRDRVLGKHKDELEVLRRCALPVVPLLNFTAAKESLTSEWREQLARAGMHAVAEFDTVILDVHGEQRLFEKMRTLLDEHRDTLDALLREREDQKQRLIRASSHLLADLLIDVAAYVEVVPAGNERHTLSTLDALRDRVRRREQQCVDQLLDLHQFRAGDYETEQLPIADGQWGLDLFSPEALKQMGLETGGAVAAGALTGLALDMMVGGISLGAATAAGATAGALFGFTRRHGRRVWDRMRGMTELRCNDTTLRLLASRQMQLIKALMKRGHASQEPIRLKASKNSDLWDPAARKLPAPLIRAKAHPAWSNLAPHARRQMMADADRDEAHMALADQIVRTVQETLE